MAIAGRLEPRHALPSFVVACARPSRTALVLAAAASVSRFAKLRLHRAAKA